MKKYSVYPESELKIVKYSRIIAQIIFVCLIVAVIGAITSEVFFSQSKSGLWCSIAFLNLWLLILFGSLYIYNKKSICRFVVLDETINVCDHKECIVYSRHYTDVVSIQCLKVEGIITARVSRKYSLEFICLIFNKSITFPPKPDMMTLVELDNDIVYFAYTDEAWQDMKNIFGDKVIELMILHK